jgi:hypothetical protein
MSRCQHNNFKGNVEVNRLTDTDSGRVTGYAADIKVNCADCSMPFQWLGTQSGLDYRKPMCSADRTELRAPIIPTEED